MILIHDLLNVKIIIFVRGSEKMKMIARMIIWKNNLFIITMVEKISDMLKVSLMTTAGFAIVMLFDKIFQITILIWKYLNQGPYDYQNKLEILNLHKNHELKKESFIIPWLTISLWKQSLTRQLLPALLPALAGLEKSRERKHDLRP